MMLAGVMVLGHGSTWIGAGWRSGRAVTQVRAEESINPARHVHLSEMEMWPAVVRLTSAPSRSANDAVALF